ncbi:RtcB family protein [Phormidesmis sp. 146-12]
MSDRNNLNHFIELCLDTEDQVWLMLHSGSRNIGNMLAQNHINTGKQLAKLMQDKLPDPDLAYFVAGTSEFDDYWRDLQWAQQYALYNREVMMARFQRVVEKHLAGGKPTKPLLSVNCHHNYAEKEVHYGEEVYVTRKGAVRARETDYGIIPGLMGAKSFIVKGKGNHESYCSCFAAGTQVLTENGLMSIEDVFQSDEDIKLISYNADSQRFEAKEILEKSERLALANQYSLSQTRRRLNNTITCTANHPFATYERGKLVYRSVEEIAQSSIGAIVPTQLNLPSHLTIADQDTNFYYLLGLILSDGTIHIRERQNAPQAGNRPRGGKYMHTYVRIYQAATPVKRSFMEAVEVLFRNYTPKVSVREQKPRASQLGERPIQSQGLIELTISDPDFVMKVYQLMPKLPSILMSNPLLSLYFLAGYLDGDGSCGSSVVSISIGKQKMFSVLVCTFLSLGIVYKVYPNRTNYVIEFRDNATLNKLRDLCKRIIVDTFSERKYSDKLVLAHAIAGGELVCPDLSSKAKQGKMVSLSQFAGQNLDATLTMNRVFKTQCDLDTMVYNFTVKDNHNYVVFTSHYTPVLVHNCSHGAGRLMSRNRAKNAYTLDDLIRQTEGVECRKDEGVLDEIPAAYKPIDQVMANQADLVEVVATLKQVICVKG